MAHSLLALKLIEDLEAANDRAARAERDNGAAVAQQRKASGQGSGTCGVLIHPALAVTSLCNGVNVAAGMAATSCQNHHRVDVAHTPTPVSTDKRCLRALTHELA
jgi:hypothetical protein